MPSAWDPDDLQFALVRSWFIEPARQVADDLLSAADQPGGRLREISPLAARLRAAQVLLAAGERDEAAAVVRRAVQAAGPDTRAMDLLETARFWVTVGEPADAEALAMRSLEAGQDLSWTTMARLDGLRASLGRHGHSDAEQRLFEAMTVQFRGKRARRANRELFMIAKPRAEQMKRQISAGIVLGGQDSPIARPGPPVQDGLPWPAPVRSMLAWWPEAEYHRIVRQVPELAMVLGAPWRDHTARVESAMRAAWQQQGGAGAAGAGLSLAAASFGGFVTYLEVTGADPRWPQVMTMFIDAWKTAAARLWPPPPGERCWCGSGQKYQRCCGS